MTNRNLLHGKRLNGILNSQRIIPNIKKELITVGAIALLGVAYITLDSMDYNDEVRLGEHNQSYTSIADRDSLYWKEK